MSDNPAEKKQGFERWVASLKLSKNIRSNPPPAPDAAVEEEQQPLTLDEQATLINRIPKEVIYKLRERDSGRAMPKSDDSTAVFTPPPELLARARRFEAPPKPERSSPTSSSGPISSSSPPVSPRVSPPISSRSPPITPRNPPSVPRPSAAEVEAAAFASMNNDEEATTYYRPDISELPSSVPPKPIQELSRPGDIQWIDGLASSPPSSLPPSSHAHPQGAPPGSSIAPSERRVRWVAIIVALLLLGGIFMLSRLQ
jgi:hypothetical protein